VNILCIGDVVGEAGCTQLARHLPALKRLKAVDLTIVNGENSEGFAGISPRSAERIFKAGADIITTGNHAFRCSDVYSSFEENEFLLRPANYPSTAPGRGMGIFDMGRQRVCVINLMGVVYMESLKPPFEAAEELLAQVPKDVKVIIIDFHAEATSEKKALAYHLDGRASAIFGTHTHVQTADEQILPKGTGFITDAGMTGPINSVLGVAPELAVSKLRDKLPVRFKPAEGECMLNGILFEIEQKTGLCTAVERIALQ
jgi:metallophosphoesterase (TIGR00282 family)